MSKQKIKSLIESLVPGEGMVESGLSGVQFFRYTQAMACAPAVYEPCVVALVSGVKEAVLDGTSYVYGDEEYMCCSMSMPVEAGMPKASPEHPLMGVYISLDTQVMTELVIQVESAKGSIRKAEGTAQQGFNFARWDDGFTQSLLSLVELSKSPADMAILGTGRLRELYYAVLKGDAGQSARSAYGIGNEIARSIDYLASRLNETISIEDMAAEVGMSRAVFHRKFKQATTMSPIQFVKAMRLNNAAMKIAHGSTVSSAAMDVGYVSSSQFSREFKRFYGQSPKQWSQAQHIPNGLM